MNHKFLVIAVFCLAFYLRFFKLGSVPEGINADEAAIGYNAYSILKTGRDEYGVAFPLTFRSFDDYKAPLYIYLTTISLVLFGLNNFSVRFMSALAGSLTVVLAYILTSSFLNNDNKALFYLPSRQSSLDIKKIVPIGSAFMLAISPWHLQFSRTAYEANISVFFFVLGLVFFYQGLLKSKYFLLSGLALILSMWSYHAPRVFVPIFVLALTIIYYRELRSRWKMVLITFFVTLILLLPLIYIFFSPAGLIRAKGISSLENPKIVDRSITWILQDNKDPMAIILHNRRIEYAREFVKGYLEHFNPEFLFLERAAGKYRAPGVGLLYLWELPFLVLGIIILFLTRKRWSLMLILCILFAPVPAAPTLWIPNPVRTIQMLPALQITVAFGVYATLGWINSNKRFFKIPEIVIIIAVIFSGFTYYLHQYYIHLPIDYASELQYGRRQLVEEVTKREQKYDKIVVSTSVDQPQIFFLYFLRYDPDKYLMNGGTVSGKFDTQENHFGKYVFKNPANYKLQLNEKVLYAASAGEAPPDAQVQEVIKYPDGSNAFVLYELNS